MSATTIHLPTTYAPAATARTSVHSVSRKANVALWVLQAALAALFLFAGGMKLVMPIAEMTKQIALPGGFLRFIGVAEVAGALGLVLPGIFRIKQHLTPLAARGLVIIMSGAVGITMALGQIEPAILPGVIGALAACVAYFRGRSLTNAR
jgi:hypothetical protein